MRAPDPPPVPMPRPRSAHIPPRSCPPLPSSPPLSCSPLPPPSRNPSGPRSCTQVTVWRTALWTRIPPLCGFLPSAPPPRGRILSIAPPPSSENTQRPVQTRPHEGWQRARPFLFCPPVPGGLAGRAAAVGAGLQLGQRVGVGWPASLPAQGLCPAPPMVALLPGGVSEGQGPPVPSPGAQPSHPKEH